MNSKPLLLCLTFALAHGVACTKEKPPENPTNTNRDEAGGGATTARPKQATAEQYPDKDPNKGNIVIGPKIAALCKDVPTAYFPFDSASIDGEAKRALTILAECFVSGPAKGKGMRLVGHADPRGETEYNYGLGQRRAGAVARALVGAGMPANRIATSSRGELDAEGGDEAGWARDRKVEIFLAED